MKHLTINDEEGTHIGTLLNVGEPLGAIFWERLQRSVRENLDLNASVDMQLQLTLDDICHGNIGIITFEFVDDEGINSSGSLLIQETWLY
jgi:hypothetical protein